MTDSDLDHLGPIDYLVVEFPAGAANFTGEMAQELANLAAAMDPGSVAGVLVRENLWSTPFGSAVRRLGGQLMANGRIPTQAIIPALRPMPQP